MIEIRPMDESYIHVDCLHDGPVDPSTYTHGAESSEFAAHPWTDETIAQLAKKHDRLTHGYSGHAGLEFMREMIQRYGTCAMLAWEGGKVVGQLRFYPLTIAQLVYQADPEKHSLLQEGFGAMVFEADPGTLWVHCLMAALPFIGRDEVFAHEKLRFPSMAEAGARKGTGLRLVQGLISWAKEREWKRIVKQAHADLDYMYGIFGGGGKRLWEKAGFRVIGTHCHDWPQDDFGRAIVECQRKEKRMSEEEAQTWFHMAYDL